MTDKTKNFLDGELKDGEVYVCHMTFTTKGKEDGVRMDYTYSHDFDDTYEGDVPASYLAMRDTAIMLTRMVGLHENNVAQSKADAILELGNGLTENNSTKGTTH